MAEDAFKDALKRVSGPVNQVQLGADGLVALAFQRIRTLLGVVDETDRTDRRER